MIINSNTITCVDTTDTKKIDIHISSNHPTVQIYNGETYTPNWDSNTPLILTATVYADSTDITKWAKFKWVEIRGSEINEYSLSSTDKILTISNNALANTSMIRYKCYATYNEKTYSNEVTFTRINDGVAAPMVQAQYSVDGNGNNWETVLDSSIHKYIRFSYDGGISWTEAIRITGEPGEDGQSITLKGVAYTNSVLIAGGAVTLYSSETTQNSYTLIRGENSGDSYLVKGYLCVYNGTDFICTGQLQGPKGDKGDSYYLFIRYADSATGSGMSASPTGKKYIGFYRSSVNQAPTDSSATIWNWAKFAGEDAKSITLTGNAQVFKINKSNTISPETIIVTAQTVNTTIPNDGWTYSLDGGKTFSTTVPTGVVRNGNTVTLTGANITSNSIIIKASNEPYGDVFTIYKVSDGVDGKPGDDGEAAPIAFLTNENITFAANANGQVSGTTMSCHVVSYNGTTKITPTIGEISGLPTGMTVGSPTIFDNELILVFTIANNTTLGSTQNINGTITIPITSPVETDLKLTWSKVNSGVKGDKGDAGVGIKSTTVMYGVSDSASTKPADSVWQSTIPVVVEGKYLWTRTIIDYTDDTVPDTVTYTYVKQGIKGDTGSSGSSVTVTSIQYKEGTSATTAPTGTWSDSVVSVAEGKYLWTKTAFSDGKTAYGVAKQGVSGKDGVGINSTTVDYGVSDAATVQPTTWQQTIPTVAEGKYLWTRTVTDYTDKSKADTVTYVYAKQGSKGETGTAGTSITVKSIKYQAGTSATTTPTGTWSDSVVAVAEGNYLWTQTTFSDNKVAYGVAKQGQKGDQGIQGPKGNDSYTVILTNESHIFAGDVSNAIADSATTQVLAYNGSTAQTVTIVSVNGKTAATADTDTGIAGLKFKCSALSGASPTITFTCTTSFVSKSGSIPIVLSVGGVQFTKMFTYSIAFKGSTGAQGSAGTPGTPASLVNITPSAHYFKSTTGKDGTFTPDYIYLYPRFQTVTFSKWEYSVNGGTTWVAASGANGLTISTYNSVANALRIAKTSTLYTDTVTSISFRCVSSNALVYDTVSIAKIYDVVDLQIEGRNLLLNSGILVTNSAYNIKTYELTTTPIVGETYTLTLKGKLGEGKSHFSAYNSGGNVTLAALARVGTSDLYTKTFTWTNGGRTDLDKSVFIYVMANSTVAESTIEWIKLEKGTLATDWVPAPEDYKSTTFQLYAPKGYLITNDVPEVILQTFAYDGGQVITGATFAWYSWNGEAWVAISGATGTSLTLNKSSVLKSNVYKCIMTYKGKTYEATATVEDKTDIYDCLINVTAKYSPTNRIYWVLHTTVFSEEGERDKLLGPVSVTAPTSPTTGSYWYKVDEANYTVTLMKYSGTAWATTTDKQEFMYDWFLFNDTTDIVSLGAQSKVKIITSNDFSRVCSVQCNVSDSSLVPITHNNQMLTDPSDPVVSSTEPINPINGQLWIKTGANGIYTLLVWDASLGQWIVSEADSQVKVHISKPTSYEVGDVWVVGSDYEPIVYVNGVAQTTKHFAGTMLKAQYSSQTYKDSDWVEALNYKRAIDELKENLNVYNQYFTFDETGMTMRAKNLSGQISEFSTKLTNNELGFYQGENKVAYINNNQLNISKAEITNGMTIGGTSPILEIGNFAIIQESNGSLSIGLKS